MWDFFGNSFTAVLLFVGFYYNDISTKKKPFGNMVLYGLLS